MYNSCKLLNTEGVRDSLHLSPVVNGSAPVSSVSQDNAVPTVHKILIHMQNREISDLLFNVSFIESL